MSYIIPYILLITSSYTLQTQKVNSVITNNISVITPATKGIKFIHITIVSTFIIIILFFLKNNPNTLKTSSTSDIKQPALNTKPTSDKEQSTNNPSNTASANNYTIPSYNNSYTSPSYSRSCYSDNTKSDARSHYDGNHTTTHGPQTSKNANPTQNIPQSNPTQHTGDTKPLIHTSRLNPTKSTGCTGTSLFAQCDGNTELCLNKLFDIFESITIKFHPEEQTKLTTHQKDSIRGYFTSNNNKRFIKIQNNCIIFKCIDHNYVIPTIQYNEYNIKRYLDNATDKELVDLYTTIPIHTYVKFGSQHEAPVHLLYSTSEEDLISKGYVYKQKLTESTNINEVKNFFNELTALRLQRTPRAAQIAENNTQEAISYFRAIFTDLSDDEKAEIRNHFHDNGSKICYEYNNCIIMHITDPVDVYAIIPKRTYQFFKNMETSELRNIYYAIPQGYAVYLGNTKNVPLHLLCIKDSSISLSQNFTDGQIHEFFSQLRLYSR